MAAVASRIFLHVGTTKTGTTFLQRVLWAHRERLLKQGVLLPGTGVLDHFRACLDVREAPHLVRDPHAIPGAWRRLVDEMAAWAGDAVVSHELFAPATAEQAEHAIGMLGDGEVHVVLTARDLVRQVPAEWQEHLKHRSVLAFPDFLAQVRSDPERGPFSPNGYWFWQEQDLVALLHRWGGSLPRERVHVVTVPPPGAAQEELWGRFAGLVGVAGHDFDLAKGRVNSSLRAEQAELLRRLNVALGDRLPLPGPYPETVKTLLAHQLLAGRTGTRFGLAGDDRAFAVRRAEELVAGIAETGVDVVGDLRDLVPGSETADLSEDVSADAAVATEAVLDEAVEALAEVLDWFDRERRRRQQLRAELDEALERLTDAEAGPGRRGPGGGLRTRAAAAVRRIRRR